MAVVTSEVNQKCMRTPKYQMVIKNENYIYKIPIYLKLQQKNNQVTIFNLS